MMTSEEMIRREIEATKIARHARAADPSPLAVGDEFELYGDGVSRTVEAIVGDHVMYLRGLPAPCDEPIAASLSKLSSMQTFRVIKRAT